MAEHHDAVGHATAEQEYLVTPPGAGHEHTDANVWLIAKFGLWLVISAVIIHVGMGFLFGLFVQQRDTIVLTPLLAMEPRRLWLPWARRVVHLAA